MEQNLDRAAAEEGLSRSDLIGESLRDYLFMRRFRQLRSRMMAKAQAQDIQTDDDIFKCLT